MDIFQAARTGNMEEIKKWIKEGKDIEMKDRGGWTLLKLASCNGHFEAVKLLLLEGANANSQDNEGDNSLLCSSYYGLDKIAELLLHHGADVNLTDRNNQTPLMEAAKTHRNEVFKTMQLLIRSGVNLKAKNKEGTTALGYALRRNEPKLLLLFTKYAKQLNEEDQNRLNMKYKVKFGKYLLENSLL